jgi:hypothetical protein
MKALTVGVLFYFFQAILVYGAAGPESLLDRDLHPLPKPRSRWGRDPFLLNRAEERKPENTGNLALSAIIFREGGGAAIINDQIVRLGDTIGEGVVTAILSDRVLVQERGRVLELRVEPFGPK